MVCGASIDCQFFGQVRKSKFGSIQHGPLSKHTNAKSVAFRMPDNEQLQVKRVNSAEFEVSLIFSEACVDRFLYEALFSHILNAYLTMIWVPMTIWDTI